MSHFRSLGAKIFFAAFIFASASLYGQSQFVLTAYENLKARFYDPRKLSPALLFNASLDGIAKYLEKNKAVFSPEKIDPAADETFAELVFAEEFERAEQILCNTIPTKEHELAFAATEALLKAVDDSHTRFINPQEWREIQAGMTGKGMFVGTGDLYRRGENGSLYVTWVYPGGPADKAGLRRFDRIVTIDGIPLPAEKEYIEGLLRGGRCTEVTLGVLRNGKSLDVAIERNVIVFPVASEETINAGGKRFGYFHLYSFENDKAFDKIFRYLKSERENAERLSGYVIDLRENGGGQFNVVLGMLCLFLEKGQGFLVNQDAGRRNVFVNKSVPLTRLPVVVLVNDASGSASEIFAAVMQEQKRATIVGKRTRGVVSQGLYFPLPYGSGMVVAVAQIFTAQGKPLEKFGVTPDVRVELTDKDIAQGKDSQLEKAVEILEKQTK